MRGTLGVSGSGGTKLLALVSQGMISPPLVLRAELRKINHVLWIVPGRFVNSHPGAIGSSIGGEFRIPRILWIARRPRVDKLDVWI